VDGSSLILFQLWRNAAWGDGDLRAA